MKNTETAEKIVEIESYSEAKTQFFTAAEKGYLLIA